MNHTRDQIKEGEIYKTIVVEGRSFEIRYGYYEDYEREKWDPIPIYPNFLESPVYSKDGYPFVTRTQDACIHYISRMKSGDSWCADCIHFPDETQEIGICRCIYNNVNNSNSAVKEKNYEKESV